MKVIDLLNKIAKGEEVPKRIKYNDKNWNYKDGIMEYNSDDTYFCLSNFEFDELNDEVEIIEEPQEHKIPEKLENYKSDDDSLIGLRETINVMYDDASRKINEILDYLEEIK